MRCSTPSFKKSDSLRFQSFTDNKENLFLQISSKKSEKRPKIQYILNHTEIDQAQLIQKIKELDLENSRLRDLLKNTQYHKITRAEIEPIEIQFDDKQFCQSIHESLNKNKKNIEKKRNLLVKQLEEDKSHKRKIQNYTQEAIQEQQLFEVTKNLEQLLSQSSNYNCAYQFSSEIFKDLILSIIKKDSQIYQNLDETIQKELDQNYIENNQTKDQNIQLLRQLIQIVEKLLNSFSTQHPDKPIIMRTLNEMQQYFEQQKKLNDRLKLFLTPINHLSNNMENIYSILDQANDQIKQLNSHIHSASFIITKLVQQNSELMQIVKENNQDYQMELKENERKYLKSLYYPIIETSGFEEEEEKDDDELIVKIKKKVNKTEIGYKKLKEKYINNKKKIYNFMIEIAEKQFIQLKEDQTILLEILTFKDLKELIRNNFQKMQQMNK